MFRKLVSQTKVIKHKTKNAPIKAMLPTPQKTHATSRGTAPSRQCYCHRSNSSKTMLPPNKHHHQCNINSRGATSLPEYHCYHQRSIGTNAMLPMQCFHYRGNTASRGAMPYRQHYEATLLPEEQHCQGNTTKAWLLT
jgi:hypothetical protein